MQPLLRGDLGCAEDSIPRLEERAEQRRGVASLGKHRRDLGDLARALGLRQDQPGQSGYAGQGVDVIRAESAAVDPNPDVDTWVRITGWTVRGRLVREPGERRIPGPLLLGER